MRESGIQLGRGEIDSITNGATRWPRMYGGLCQRVPGFEGCGTQDNNQQDSFSSRHTNTSHARRLILMVGDAGLELATSGSGDQRSIHLS